MTTSGLDRDGEEMMKTLVDAVAGDRRGFSEGAKVVVEQCDAKNWQVREPFSYRAAQDVFDVYKDMGTDFASVPRIFVWFLPRYGRYTKAAIVHDLLWRDYAAAGKMDWIDADGIFRRAMRELGVPFLQRWIMWTAVRWAALLKPRGRRRWLHELPRVAFFTVVAAPIVLPPAAVIVVAYAAYLVVEAVVWVPLKAGQLIRRLAGQPVKKVNPPDVDWRLS